MSTTFSKVILLQISLSSIHFCPFNKFSHQSISSLEEIFISSTLKLVTFWSGSVHIQKVVKNIPKPSLRKLWQECKFQVSLGYTDPVSHPQPHTLPKRKQYQRTFTTLLTNCLGSLYYKIKFKHSIVYQISNLVSVYLYSIFSHCDQNQKFQQHQSQAHPQLFWYPISMPLLHLSSPDPLWFLPSMWFQHLMHLDDSTCYSLP
jgi:hypothetical protein